MIINFLFSATSRDDALTSVTVHSGTDGSPLARPDRGQLLGELIMPTEHWAPLADQLSRTVPGPYCEIEFEDRTEIDTVTPARLRAIMQGHPEIEAMRRIVDVLDQLEPDARSRVLRWYSDYAGAA